MSYDFAVWEGERPRDDEHAQDVLAALRALYTHDDSAPTALIAKYAAALQVRWPATTPWTTGTLIGGATGPLLQFGLPDGEAASVGPDAAYVARALGLVCFDVRLGRLVTGLVDSGRPAWVAVISVDPDFFEAHGSDGFDGALPSAAERRIELSDSRTRVGRFSRKHVVNPQIDLSVAPADPWVSRAHVDLAHDPAGNLWVIDLGSEHGVWVNDAPKPLTSRNAAVLGAGDRLHLGRWTTITIAAADSA
ncbi:FHA domain-containing protein [Pseudonocardia sp. GCM10023141]|uniref:FHA domain-containing protein n=1 Tax=Pseudonocardia sp. GCM10023141 TaxID=3252653 RepID=UPI0036164074